MPWSALTISDLNDARASELIESVRTESLALGQTDPVPRLIAAVVAELRQCIAFGGATISSTENTIPSGLKSLALEKICRTAKRRLLLPLDAAEESAEALYQKRLEQLTRGQWPVEPPDDPAPTSSTIPPTGHYGSTTPIAL